MVKTKLIVNLTRGECVCVSELADRPLARMRGLIGRQGLPVGEGLLLSPAPSIHTAFMRFPIDALFLDRDLCVLDIRASMPPWRVASKRKARAVLELSAGECARRRVEVGDRLELRDRKAMHVRATVPEPADADELAETETRRPNAPVPRGNGGQLVRLQPFRVLVISADRRFRTVMSLLLTRRNCSVTTTVNGSRVTELITRESVDVVVIDASQSPSASTAAMVATVEGLVRPVGVVLVAGEAGSGDVTRSGLHGPPVLAKWGPFGDLFEAIERADEHRGACGEIRAHA